jgi:hypothetical protein
MSTLREELRKRLTPVLPKGYVLRPNGLALETITKPVLQLKQLAMQPSAEAPMGSLTVEFVATMAVPQRNPQAAEDQLDDDVTEMVTALDQLPDLNWTRAQKVTAGPDDQYLAYDITITFNTAYDPEA